MEGLTFCLSVSAAIGICFVFFFGLLGLMDILSGKDPIEENLSMFFEEGAIFGWLKDNAKNN